MDVPSPWLVRPRESLYDLDNIQLGHLLQKDDSVRAIFSLDALLIDGHGREGATQSPPRGVQLQLVSPSPQGETVPIQDTQVVANLGYFQFRVGPGVFGLEIREGRGREIYKMESVGGQGWDSPTVEEDGNEVALTSFEGVTLYPRLTRQPGMEKEDVLAESAAGESGGVLENLTSKYASYSVPKRNVCIVTDNFNFGRVFGMFKSKKPEETGVVPVKQQADINIFTVASGLLYEVDYVAFELEIQCSHHFTALCLYHDFERSAQHKSHREVLVHREFPLALFPCTLLDALQPPLVTDLDAVGIYPSHGCRIWIRLRTRHLQVAFLAPGSIREAAYHLGIQDFVPRRPLPDGLEEGHLRRC